MRDYICPICNGEFRMVWIGHDPPEPYGEVCDCPDDDLADARADKAERDHDFLDDLDDQDFEAWLGNRP